MLWWNLEPFHLHFSGGKSEAADGGCPPKVTQPSVLSLREVQPRASVQLMRLYICLGSNCLLSYKRGSLAGVWVDMGLGLLLRSRHPPWKSSFLISWRG